VVHTSTKMNDFEKQQSQEDTFKLKKISTTEVILPISQLLQHVIIHKEPDYEITDYVEVPIKYLLKILSGSTCEDYETIKISSCYLKQ